MPNPFKVGPLPVTSKVKNSIYSGYNPPSYPFIRPFIGAITPVAHLVGFLLKVAQARNRRGPGTPSEKLTSKLMLFQYESPVPRSPFCKMLVFWGCHHGLPDLRLLVCGGCNHGLSLVSGYTKYLACITEKTIVNSLFAKKIAPSRLVAETLAHPILIIHSCSK